MQLFSYAKHRNVAKTNGFDSSTERGYSVYVFGTDHPGDYCIFDEVWSFHYLRMLLWSSFGIIELAVTLAAPLLMISLHEVVAKKMKDYKSVFRYYFWAVILVITPLIALIYICNGFAIYSGLNGQSHINISVFVVLIGVLAVVFVLDVILAGISMCVLRKVWIKKNVCLCYLGYKPVNTDQTSENDTATSENATATSKNDIVSFWHIFSMVSITVFTQLALFHSVFISFAVIAAPVESGSLLLLYLSSLFTLISFLALGLKIANNMQHKCINCILCSYRPLAFCDWWCWSIS